MGVKNWIVLFVIVLGFASCDSSPSEKEDGEKEIVLADIRPTQTKYKAYYGTKLTKVTSALSSNSKDVVVETSKPVSVIFYPRTHTITLSNVFDNTTVECGSSWSYYDSQNPDYKTHHIVVNGIGYWLDIIEKTETSPAAVRITSKVGYYQFEIADAQEQNIKSLLSYQKQTSLNKASNYSVEYFYLDTTLVQSVRRGFNPQTLDTVVYITDYSYYDGKLMGKRLADEKVGVISNTTYKYENNLITKATIVDANQVVTNINTFKYDSSGRLTDAYYGNSTGTVFSSIRHYTYETNKLLITYTNSAETFKDTEVAVYDSSRKPFLIAEDDILDPLQYLHITKTTITSKDGIIQNFPESEYQYSGKGFLIKVTENNGKTEPDVRTFNYKEEDY